MEIEDGACVAVMSDIHGNFTAFERCVDDARRRNAEAFIFLGDYLGEFPYPQKTMALLYALCAESRCFFVRGNKEDYWLGRKGGGSFAWKEGTSSTGALCYCYAHLTPRDLDFFAALPVCREVVFEGRAPLLACHGSPRRNNEKMLPQSEATKEIMESCAARYVLCGHTHVRRVIEWGGKLALNPGSVGLANGAGAGKAQYMLLRPEGAEWRHEFVDLDYDKARVFADLRECGLADCAPYWTKTTEQVLLGGAFSHGDVLAKAFELCNAATGGAAVWRDIPEKFWAQAFEELYGLAGGERR